MREIDSYCRVLFKKLMSKNIYLPSLAWDKKNISAYCNLRVLILFKIANVSNVTFKAANEKFPRILGKSKVLWRVIGRKGW